MHTASRTTKPEMLDWLNELLDKSPTWESSLGDQLVPNITGMAPDEWSLTEANIHELLEARAEREPVRPAADQEDLMAALEVRLRQLGSEKTGKGLWMPIGPHKAKAHVLHVSWDRPGNKLLLSCGPRKRKGRPKEDFCSQADVLAALGWEWTDLYVPEHRKEAPPTFVVDLFGQVHEPPESPCTANRTWFLTETGEVREPTTKGECGTPRLLAVHGTATHRLATRLKSGEVPLHVAKKHPPVEQLEEQLAKGELRLDETLVCGPLPDGWMTSSRKPELVECSPRRAELHRQCRDLMLRELRLYAAAGEYRATMFARRYVAQKLGINRSLAGLVLQDPATLHDGASTFVRQSAPRQGAKRGGYLYYLPSAAEELHQSTLVVKGGPELAPGAGLDAAGEPVKAQPEPVVAD